MKFKFPAIKLLNYPLNQAPTCQQITEPAERKKLEKFHNEWQ